jgi:hypothetical protein
MLAVCVVLTAATVAENVAFDAPADTTTDPGTDSAPLLLLSAEVKPPPWAAELRVRVHVVVPAPVIDCVPQVSDCTVSTFRIFHDDTAFTAIAAALPVDGVIGLIDACLDSVPVTIAESVLRFTPDGSWLSCTSRTPPELWFSEPV